MFYSTSGPESYNKSTRAGHGTLMENWNEERTLREDTGVGRTQSRGHILKKHDDLFLKPAEELTSVYQQEQGNDETFGRVFGRKQEPNYQSDYRHKFTNKQHQYEPTHGKRFEQLQQQHLNEINNELQAKSQNADDHNNQRYLNSTYGNEFVQKNVGLNVIGRKVMRDQDGKSLLPNTRDEDLLVDHGYLNRQPLANDKDLQKAVKKESYVTAQPYTFWQEKVNDGAYYASKATGDNVPFSRNNDFLKTYPNYTHIKK
jgi:hypothetical protein